MNEIDKPKKRGRPKKSSLTIDEPINVISNSELILFLPIHINETITDTPKINEDEYEDLNEKINEEYDDIEIIDKDKKFFNLKTPIIQLIDGKTIIEEITNIACWWCSYNFNTIPCFIPERYLDEKYYVFGCFCCINCAVAYIFSINDYKVWDRFSLIKKMYSFMIKNNKLNISQNKEVLEKFGGCVSIEEWRKNSIQCSKEFKLIMPPMIPIIPIVEIKTKKLKK